MGTATKQNIGYLQHQRYGMRLDNWVSWQSQNEDIEIDLTFSSIFLENETLGHPIFGKKKHCNWISHDISDFIATTQQVLGTLKVHIAIL